MRLSGMYILGIILILFILAAVFIYIECCGEKPRRPNNRSHKSDSMSAAEIGVAAS